MTETKLKDLATALVIGKGEIVSTEISSFIYSEINKEKIRYLKDYISTTSLPNHRVTIDDRSIALHGENITSWALKTFYKGEEKIFCSRLDISKLSLNSIVLWINIYGRRNEDYIEVPTTVNTDYLRVLMYCLEQRLGVTILAGHKHLKIFNIKKIYDNFIPHVSINHLAVFANYFSRKEYLELVKQCRKPIVR